MHGVTANEFTHGARPISDIATNIIGIVATADDADAAVFPANKPIFSTSVSALIDKAGTKGTLAKSLDAIAAQADAQIVVVRVHASTKANEQKANVIVGAKALAKAPAHTGFKPKIIGAPELDDAEVTAELVVAANVLEGFVYASAGGAEEISALTSYKNGFGQKNLMLIDNECMALGASKNQETAATIARILGARAMLDQKIGVHKSISNTEIQGVSAIKYPRSFGLLDINSEANTINNLNVNNNHP